MHTFKPLPKLKSGDKVAILSPSFAAPGRWPHVYELGLERIRSVFGLEPVDFPTTRKIAASKEERSKDLIDAFENPEIKAVIASLGGDDQITYIKNLPKEPFEQNPKPFFGYSDNTHFINHLWQCGVPAYYGGAVFTEFAMQGHMDEFTIKYLKHALFESGEFELATSPEFNDEGLGWNDPSLLTTRRRYQPNEGWYWDGAQNAEGITWGGCLESIDEILRHAGKLPSMEEFSEIILFLETSEMIPAAGYVRRVVRALGERGILGKIKALLVGRPKAWDFNKQKSDEEKIEYKLAQREMIVATTRQYNTNIPIIQNLDFGHTAPQICMPTGRKMRIVGETKQIFVEF